MSLWKNIRDAFRPSPGNLRNRPGGLAMIRTMDGNGAEVLNGRIVTTLDADADGFWAVEPAQSYVVRCPTRFINHPHLLWMPGSNVPVGRISDAALHPLRDPGTGERDESANWLPPVPSGTPRKVTT